MLLSEDLTLVALLAGLRECSGLSGRPKSGSFPSLNQRQASQLHLEDIHILHIRQVGPVVGTSAPEIQLQSTYIPCGPSKIR